MTEPTVSVLVTGGAGFIGRNIIDALNARGHDDILVVDALNNPTKKGTTHITNTKSIACRCMVSNQVVLKFKTLLISAYFASDNTRQMIYLT